MKKIILPILIFATAIFFANCNATKKVAVTPHIVNYNEDVQTLIEANCSPCHIPSKGGKKAALDTYAGATALIDDVLRRIQLNPGDRGFMPFKHDKLSDSAINVFKNWKAAGLPETGK